jgi:hypothetical protein
VNATFEGFKIVVGLVLFLAELGGVAVGLSVVVSWLLMDRRYNKW